MADQDEDFARMFEGSLRVQRFEDGQTVTGTIVAIRSDVAFVDVGGKGEATIEVTELLDDNGEIDVAVGDRIEAVVVGTAGGIRLSRRLARGAASARQLEDAFRSGLPVEGRVERVIKGGFEVKVAGRRGFCPISQIDVAREVEPSLHVGRVYAFRILEIRDAGKSVVLSRRALLEEEQAVRAEELRRSILPGTVLTGRVTSLRDYGAFVDLGAGVQGLLHVSEIGWARVAEPSQMVRPGEEIRVQVLSVDESTGKIALSTKRLEPDPWTHVAERFAEGQVVHGTVTRHTEFGAFVELAPGIEGLAHLSAFPPTGRADGWKLAAPVGSSASFEILGVDPDRRRIGLGPVPEGSVRAERTAIAPGARITGTVERHESYGVFVFLAPGRTGLIPLEETGVVRGADLVRELPVGSKVEVAVLETDPTGRRIRLSRKAVLAAAEKAELQDYAERADAERPEAFGSLADKLRKALGR